MMNLSFKEVKKRERLDRSISLSCSDLGMLQMTLFVFFVFLFCCCSGSARRVLSAGALISSRPDALPALNREDEEGFPITSYCK